MPNRNMKVSAQFYVTLPHSVVKETHRSAIDIANAAVHLLVQDVGTQEAKRLLLDRLDDYQPDYLGYHVETVTKENQS